MTNLCSDVSVAELFVGPPLGDDRGDEAGHEAGAVEEHVKAVADQAQGVGPYSIKQLDKCKGQVQDQETEQVFRVFV